LVLPQTTDSLARSSTESEYRTLVTTAAELFWLQSMLHDLGVFLSSPPTLCCDNIGATYLSANSTFHARTKHIKIDFHFVRDKVASKTLAVRFISSKDNLADILTKSTASPYFALMHTKLNVVFPMSRLRRRNEPSTETKSLQSNKPRDSTIQGTQRLTILNKETQPTANHPYKATNGIYTKSEITNQLFIFLCIISFCILSNTCTNSSIQR
jgi:hypothetical protein